MDILGALTVAKQVLDISKDLRNIDGRISDAEFKLKRADLVERVMELQEALQDAQARESDLRNTIIDLQLKLNQKSNHRDEKGLLYEIDSEGKNFGEPYCNLCFVREEKLFRMRHIPAKVNRSEHYTCDNCKTNIVVGLGLPPKPSTSFRKRSFFE